MNTNSSVKTIALILKNLNAMETNIPITFFLNNVNSIDHINFNVTHSLHIHGDSSFEASIPPQDLALEISGDITVPITIDSATEVTIPEKTIKIHSNEKHIPITTSGNTDISLNVTGLNSTLSEPIDIIISSDEKIIALPIYAKATGSVDLTSTGEINIPTSTIIAKTAESEAGINLIGSSSTEISVEGIASGYLPELNIVGSTNKHDVVLDLTAKNSSNSISNYEISSTDTQSPVDINLSGQAVGVLTPLAVKGITDSKYVDFPVIAQGINNVDINIDGIVVIPELEVIAKTPCYNSSISTKCSDYISLNVDGVAEGILPQLNLKGTLELNKLDSDITASATGNISMESNGIATLPPSESVVHLPEENIKIKFNDSSNCFTTFSGTTSAQLPGQNILGQAKTNNLPIVGDINISYKINSTSPKVTGTIQSISSDYVIIKDLSTENLNYISINEILRLEFVTNNSLITSNKGSLGTYIYPIEKNLQEIWLKEFQIELNGSKTTNPIKPTFSTDEIKYINKGILWLETDSYNGYENKIYSLNNITGFTLKPM